MRKNEQEMLEMFHWATILDLVTDIQMKSSAFPMPSASSGRTIVGGRFAVYGQQASLVLMEGEIVANRFVCIPILFIHWKVQSEKNRYSYEVRGPEYFKRFPMLGTKMILATETTNSIFVINS